MARLRTASPPGEKVVLKVMVRTAPETWMMPLSKPVAVKLLPEIAGVKLPESDGEVRS